MRVVISMLRGVNLGKRRIKMDELRELYTSLGLRDVQTYVQSGNIVFRSDARDLNTLARRIEAAIQKKFGFFSAVILRTTSEMKDAIARSPFASRDLHSSKVLITFLDTAPAREACEKVCSMDCAPDEAQLIGRELYLYFPNGMARPKLSMAAVERAIQCQWTGRNWNTVTKLLEMAETLEKR